MWHYRVTITGDTPPFKWQVTRTRDNTSQTIVAGNGEAASVQDAMFDANEAAKQAERRRRYAATVLTEDLFSVPSDEQPQELVPDSIDFVD